MTTEITVTRKLLHESADHWDQLADAQERRLQWDPHAVTGVCQNKSALFRRAATSLRAQADDGIPRCACHLITYEECTQRRRDKR